MISYEKTFEDCVIEMFKRVGETYPNDELTSKAEWYKEHTWTETEENDFRDWMKKLLKKRYKWSDKKLEKEIGMFLLDIGWSYTK